MKDKNLIEFVKIYDSSRNKECIINILDISKISLSFLSSEYEEGSVAIHIYCEKNGYKKFNLFDCVFEDRFEIGGFYQPQENEFIVHKKIMSVDDFVQLIDKDEIEAYFEGGYVNAFDKFKKRAIEDIFPTLEKIKKIQDACVKNIENKTISIFN